MGPRFRVGTRGSPLALAQTEIVLSALRARFPDRRFEAVPIRTHGDEGAAKDLGMGLGTKRAFTKRIEDALLAGRVDAAVHSLKDLPAEDPDGLVLAAIPRRDAPWDALVSRHGISLAGLPGTARIGTSSLRRKAQLLAFRRTFHIEDLTGNIGTRLRKLDEGGLDGIVIAAAGLERLGLRTRIAETIPSSVMVPAIGQGALSVQVREDDADARSLVGAIDDPRTRTETDAERGVARALGGGCNVPMGAVAVAAGSVLRLEAVVASTDGGTVVRAAAEGSPSRPARVAEVVAGTLRRSGGHLLPGLEGGG